MSYLKDRLSPSLFVESVPVEVETWRKALMDAAEIIRTRGWCQNTVTTANGEVCMIGALWVAEKTLDDEVSRWLTSPSERALLAYLRRKCWDEDIHDWNDVPGRSAAEVIAALEGAARS